MEMIIRTVSDVFLEEKPPCKSAVLKRTWNDPKVAKEDLHEWAVNVSSIEDVLAISKEVGHEICMKAAGLDGFFHRDKDKDILTVYDSYRE
ncbi:MAG: hypothetical protein M0Q43_10590 [Methanothrix sp.]|jgi:hypothetical protein|nr:hypothetical protein [Methanothrix sp.]